MIAHTTTQQTQNILTLPPPTIQETLQDLETKARYYREQAALNWMRFCRVVMQIKESGAWRAITDVNCWGDYCVQAFGITAARVSQYKGAMAYMEVIHDAGYAVEETENHIRKLKKVVKPDDPLMIATYQTGQSVAESLGLQKPTEAIYRHAYEQLQEASIAGGHVDVGGAQVSASIPDAIEAATLSAIAEAKARNVSRMGKREKIEGRMVRDKDGKLVFIPADSSAVIDSDTKVVVYIVKDT